MDTKHLITFITFSEEKTYLKTSNKLNYAPSTLAEHILSLENELGVKLVEGRGKRTVLTESGEQFLNYARQIMATYKTACKAMSRLNSIKGTLRIMTVESLGLYSMATVFSKFMTQNPDITLSISIGNCNTIYEKLNNNEIDMAYIYDMNPIVHTDFLTTVLFKEPLCFTVAKTHPLAHKRMVTPEDFNNQTFILAQKDCYYSKAFSNLLHENHIVLKSKLELDSGNLIKKYVHSGYGITLLPYSVIKEELDAGSLSILKWSGEVWEAYAQVLTLKKEWMIPSIPALLHLSEAQSPHGFSK